MTTVNLDDLVWRHLDDTDIGQLLRICIQTPRIDSFCSSSDYWKHRLELMFPSSKHVFGLNAKETLIRYISENGVTYGSERFLPGPVMIARALIKDRDLLRYAIGKFPAGGDLLMKQPMHFLRLISTIDCIDDLLVVFDQTGHLKFETVMDDWSDGNRTLDLSSPVVNINPIVLCDTFFRLRVQNVSNKSETIRLVNALMHHQTTSYGTCIVKVSCLILLGIRWEMESLIDYQMKELSDFVILGDDLEFITGILIQICRLSAFMNKRNVIHDIIKITSGLPISKRLIVAFCIGAGQGGHRDLVGFLLDHEGDIGHLLLGVAQNGDKKLFRYLVNRSRSFIRKRKICDVIHSDKMRLDVVKSPCHVPNYILAGCFDIACRLGYVDIVGILLDTGELDSNDGIRLAIEYGHLDMTNYLLKKGADPGLSLIAVADQCKLQILRTIIRWTRMKRINGNRREIVNLAMIKAKSIFDLEITDELIKSEHT